VGTAKGKRKQREDNESGLDMLEDFFSVPMVKGYRPKTDEGRRLARRLNRGDRRKPKRKGPGHHWKEN